MVFLLTTLAATAMMFQHMLAVVVVVVALKVKIICLAKIIPQL
jgi:hypothetical protein